MCGAKSILPPVCHAVPLLHQAYEFVIHRDIIIATCIENQVWLFLQRRWHKEAMGADRKGRTGQDRQGRGAKGKGDQEDQERGQRVTKGKLAARQGAGLDKSDAVVNRQMHWLGQQTEP